MNRHFHRISALLAIAALAFSQLAVSAHGCNRDMGSPEPTGMTTPCEQMTMPDANLCERHCDYGAAASDSQGAPTAVHAVAPTLLPYRVEAPASPALFTKATARTFERSIERPPLIRFSVLRI